MPISSLLDECFSNILSYLDWKALYKCLFVNRFFCKFTIPLIWREPLIWRNHKSIPLINTLLSCLNEDEISSLIPCAINFNNNQSPLFEYGKFIRKFNHGLCVYLILALLDSKDKVQDCRIQKLVKVIYHMIMRQGSNLQEFHIWGDTDLPKLSTFTTYEPGITNLRSLTISSKYENTIEFLNMVSKSCNGIVNCYLESKSSFPESFADIIKSQPLEKLSLCFHHEVGEDKKVIYALEFRSGTLKELKFEYFDFQDIDLSFMSKLDRLERLELISCERFLFTNKLHLKELTLGYDIDTDTVDDDNKLRMMINPLLTEELYKLKLMYMVTPKVAKAVRVSCPNLKYLQIEAEPSGIFGSAISHICKLSSLKVLKIKYQYRDYDGLSTGSLVEELGDNLKFVEYLFLRFHIDLSSFEYFINNCKANLKKLIIFCMFFDENPKKGYLIHASNYQKVHNSLKLFGIVGYNNRITNEESEIIDLLKNQGVRVKFYNLDFAQNIFNF